MSKQEKHCFVEIMYLVWLGYCNYHHHLFAKWM